MEHLVRIEVILMPCRTSLAHSERRLVFASLALGRVWRVSFKFVSWIIVTRLLVLPSFFVHNLSSWQFRRFSHIGHCHCHVASNFRFCLRSAIENLYRGLLNHHSSYVLHSDDRPNFLIQHMNCSLYSCVVHVKFRPHFSVHQLIFNINSINFHISQLYMLMQSLNPFQKSPIVGSKFLKFQTELFF